jgi:hypothetical protein
MRWVCEIFSGRMSKVFLLPSFFVLLQLFSSFMSSSASWNCICLVHCDYAKFDFESGREAYEWCQNGYKLC